MKYVCILCKKEFNDENINDRSGSLLVNSLIISCPYCKSLDVDLTEHGKVLVDRRAKINKINSSEE